MRRVKRDRTGYSGYDCIGLPMLAPVYRGIIAPDGSALIDDSIAAQHDEDSDRELNDWQHLPVSSLSFVAHVEPIYDMRYPFSDYPEKSCEDNQDIFAGGTFYNYYVNPYAYGAWYKLKALSEQPAAAVAVAFDTSDEEHYAAMLNFCPVEYIPIIDSVTSETIGNQIAFGSLLPSGSSTELTMSCGMLEPMLQTDFGPVDISASTAFDASLDGAMFTLVQLTKWRLAVDNQLSELISGLSHLKGIRDMLTAEQKSSNCENFKIRLTKGDPIQWKQGSVEPPEYSVDAGIANINGVDIEVQGLQELTPPFYVYLNIRFTDPDEETGQYQTTTATLELEEDGDYSLGIGGVRIVTTSKKKLVAKYTVFEIIQERCNVTVDTISTSKPGVLYRTEGPRGGSGRTSASPYEVLETASCEDE